MNLLFLKVDGMIIKYILAVFIVPLLISCSKDKKHIVKNNWQVESVKVHADSSLTFPVNTYILYFENSKRYHIKLDVNSCSAKVRFRGKNKVDFDAPGCTFICCDSNFAEKIAMLLKQIRKYDLKGSVLILKGEKGEIINLKKI